MYTAKDHTNTGTLSAISIDGFPNFLHHPLKESDYLIEKAKILKMAGNQYKSVMNLVNGC